MSQKLKLQDINFDDEKQVKKLANEKIEVEVGMLDFLLEYFYLGGGEPRQKNSRLKIALKYKDEF
jgi:hypothetical protein